MVLGILDFGLGGGVSLVFSFFFFEFRFLLIFIVFCNGVVFDIECFIFCERVIVFFSFLFSELLLSFILIGRFCVSRRTDGERGGKGGWGKGWEVGCGDLG